MSVEKLVQDMQSPKALPMGLTDFNTWADNIIDKAMMPESVPRDQQKYVLADAICHLGPMEDHKEDAYFIKYLRKIAVNQVAAHYRDEFYKAKKAASDAVKSVGEPKEGTTDVLGKAGE